MAYNAKYSFLINKRVLLIRIGGELGIKSRQTRRYMIDQLQHNIKARFRHIFTFNILNYRNRLIIYSESSIDLDKLAFSIVTSISGVSSVSPVLVVEATENSILSAGKSEAINIIQPYTSFAIRARREGSHPFSSIEIASKLGAEILAYPLEGIKVDLEAPKFQIHLDISGILCFIYSHIYKGMDGLPSRSQGTAIALLKPNFNSILAAWLMKKRGVKITPIFFKTGKTSEENFLEHIQLLFSQDITIVRIEELLALFKHHSSLCLYCQIYCEQVCKKVANKYQVSTIVSPTCFNYNNEIMSLEALKILEKNINLAILRPLQLGYYGQEIKMKELDKKACCQFKTTVSLQPFEDFNDTNLKEILSFKLKI
ncbi:MAG: THUMP domain-containing protein [Promethearchaeota archaeon]